MTIETANRLYELRKEKGLSQEELAEKLGVSRQAVSKWERSEASPDTDNLIALAKIYGLSLDELVYGKKAADPSAEPYTNDSQTNGIHVQTDDATVTINPERITLVSDDGDTVKIDFKDGIKISTTDDDDDDEFDDEEKTLIEESNGKARLWLSIPYPIVCVAAYLLFGFLDICGGFGQSWIIFVTIPMYYTLISAIFKKSFSEFAYPVFCAFLYLYFGMYHGNWHPSWIVFVTIPLYYPIAGAIDKSISNRKSTSKIDDKN